MRRRLWIVTMAFIALLATGSTRATAYDNEPENCRAAGSICSNGTQCCSQICDCNGTDCRWRITSNASPRTPLAGQASGDLGGEVYMPDMRAWKEIVLNIVTVLVTVAALLAVGFRVKDYISPPGSSGKSARRVIADWREVQRGGHRIGPENARVSIIEFADFECPVCSRAAADLRELRQENPNEISVTFRHFPLAKHRYAREAAKAAVCADRQGRFDAFHDVVFSSHESIGTTSWQRFAEKAGVPDIAALNACLSDQTAEARVRADIQLGEKLGINGVPTLLINGMEVPGHPGKEQLASMVRAALKGH